MGSAGALDPSGSRASPTAVTAVLLSIVLWAIGFPLTEIALRSTSPALLSELRFALTSVVLLPFALRDPAFFRALVSRHSAFLGLTGVALYYAFTSSALAVTTAGTASLTTALSPAITAAVAAVALRERPSRSEVMGLILSTAGVALVASAGARLDGGVLLFIVGMVSYAVYTAALRGWDSAGRLRAVTLATCTSIWGAALLLPWTSLEWLVDARRLPDGTGWMMLGFLVVGVTAPTVVLFNFGAERLPVMVTGILMASLPAAGYAVAIAFGEVPDATRALGGVVAIAGVVVAVAFRSRERGAGRR